MQFTYNFDFCFRPNFSIYVGGLDPAVTDDKLHDYFLKNYPSVKGAKIMYEGGISKFVNVFIIC